MSPDATRLSDADPKQAMGFGGLSIAFDHRIIEPRPWTVAQSRWASALMERVPVGPVLEVCCGAGHIGLLAAQGNNRAFVQVDVDPVACEYAALNASAAGMAERVSVRCGPMDEVLAAGEIFAMIIADPPYLPTASVTRFPEDPPIAIDGGEQGLDLIADCLDLVNKHLAHEGAAVLQVANLAQAHAVHQHLTMHPELGITQVDQRDCGRGVLVQLAHIGSSRRTPPIPPTLTTARTTERADDDHRRSGVLTPQPSDSQPQGR